MEKDVRRLNILYEIIKEMISTNQWSITLKEKLEKMEELFSNIQSYDEAFIQSWTDKIVDLWKQYSMLSNYGIDEESIQPNNSLKENDIVWKILVSSKKITVMAASVGEINYLQHSIKNGNNEEIPKEQPLEPKLSKETDTKVVSQDIKTESEVTDFDWTMPRTSPTTSQNTSNRINDDYETNPIGLVPQLQNDYEDQQPNRNNYSSTMLKKTNSKKGLKPLDGDSIYSITKFFSDKYEANSKQQFLKHKSRKSHCRNQPNNFGYVTSENSNLFHSNSNVYLFCNYCKKPGHIEDNCELLYSHICRICDTPGHVERDCPNGF